MSSSTGLPGHQTILPILNPHAKLGYVGSNSSKCMVETGQRDAKHKVQSGRWALSTLSTWTPWIQLVPCLCEGGVSESQKEGWRTPRRPGVFATHPVKVGLESDSWFILFASDFRPRTNDYMNEVPTSTPRVKHHEEHQKVENNDDKRTHMIPTCTEDFPGTWHGKTLAKPMAYHHCIETGCRFSRCHVMASQCKTMQDPNPKLCQVRIMNLLEIKQPPRRKNGLAILKCVGPPLINQWGGNHPINQQPHKTQEILYFFGGVVACSHMLWTPILSSLTQSFDSDKPLAEIPP